MIGTYAIFIKINNCQQVSWSCHLFKTDHNMDIMSLILVKSKSQGRNLGCYLSTITLAIGALLNSLLELRILICLAELDILRASSACLAKGVLNLPVMAKSKVTFFFEFL